MTLSTCQPGKEPGTGGKEIQTMLGQLFRRLASPVDETRQATVRAVQEICLPVVVNNLVDRLVEAVKRGRKTAQPAASTLAEMGAPALIALTRVLLQSRNPAVQLRVLGILERLAWKVDGDDRFHLMTTLLGAGRLAEDETVLLAVAKVLTEVTHTSQGTTGATPGDEVRMLGLFRVMAQVATVQAPDATA